MIYQNYFYSIVTYASSERHHQNEHKSASNDNIHLLYNIIYFEKYQLLLERAFSLTTSQIKKEGWLHNV